MFSMVGLKDSGNSNVSNIIMKYILLPIFHRYNCVIEPNKPVLQINREETKLIIIRFKRLLQPKVVIQ